MKKRTAEEAWSLIAAGEGLAVLNNLHSFEELDPTELALAIIAYGRSEFVAKNLGFFEGSNHNEIALAIIADGHGRSVLRHLRSFEVMNQSNIARALIADGLINVVAANLDWFKGLDSEIALSLITAGYGRDVRGDLNTFFEEILRNEPDALLASRHLAQGAWERDETITFEEFMGLLKAARAVAAHKPTPRELPAHAG